MEADVTPYAASFRLISSDLHKLKEERLYKDIYQYMYSNNSVYITLY